MGFVRRPTSGCDQDFAHQQGQLDDVNATLSVAVKKLATAEAAFESYLQGKDPLNEEQWRALSAAKVDDEAFDGDPKLLRMIRVSCLADSVATLQRQRDVANSELVAKREELDDARRRFEFEDAQHSGCTWNCSVKRAAPFYEKRRLHESKVDQQLQQLQLVEQRLHVARQKVAQLQAESPSGRSRRSRQLDELSLQSFEIAGGEPALDEWHSPGRPEESDGRVRFLCYLRWSRRRAGGTLLGDLFRAAGCQMRNVSAIEREVARTAQFRSPETLGSAELAADAKLHARGLGQTMDWFKGRLEVLHARETRHGFLQDVFSVSLQLPKWMSGSGWLLLGSCPVLGAERLLQRSAAGVKLRGISGDGPMKEGSLGGLPILKQYNTRLSKLNSSVRRSHLPGAPWFGPRRVRLLLALMAGMLLTALDRCLSPFAAVIGGCLETLLLLLRAGFASIWICDWRLQELWRKKT
eukprot:g32300.t1